MQATPSNDVLVVEDDPDLNETVGAYLELEGFEYRPALDGASALREAQGRCPSLVLLDLMLPDVDGLEVCRRLRADPRTHGVPVVILSALNEVKIREAARELGVCDYLTKPFDPDTLLAAIRRYAARP